MQPKLKLLIDVKADIENAKYFVQHGEFVDWFLPLNFQYIKSKKFTRAERNKIILEYTKNYHELNRRKILEGVRDTQHKWSKIEAGFYKITDQIFQGHSWPKGKYVGFASIYLMFPRNIQERTFFFPYSADGWNPVGTIAHEMLHFIFFDYIEKKYKIKEGDKIPGKDPKYVWRVSETFNTMIENWLPYRKVLASKEGNKPYPGCEKMFKTMMRQWEKNQDIETFLSKWF